MRPTAPERDQSRLALLAVSPDGAALAARLSAAWPEADRYVHERYAEPELQAARRLSPPLGEPVAKLFARYGGLIFFLPLGAVVRLIAPCLGDKLSDPAVVAVDDGGRFAISVLSGHAGGANQLAERVAAALGAQQVITTAIERHGRTAPELVGRPYGWKLEASGGALLRVAATLAQGLPVAVYQDDGPRDWRAGLQPLWSVDRLEQLADAATGGAIAISDRQLPEALLEHTVVWRPRGLVVGLGCSSGAPLDELEQLLDEALTAAGLARGGIGALATLDRKLTEPALQTLAHGLGLPVQGYAAAELAPIDVPNPSEVVRRAVGCPSVAEAAARLAAGGGELLVPKRASPHATVAIAHRAQER
jgi:cobalamin biosynthesis protein CbiG